MLTKIWSGRLLIYSGPLPGPPVHEYCHRVVVNDWLLVFIAVDFSRAVLGVVEFLNDLQRPLARSGLALLAFTRSIYQERVS